MATWRPLISTNLHGLVAQQVLVQLLCGRCSWTKMPPRAAPPGEGFLILEPWKAHACSKASSTRTAGEIEVYIDPVESRPQQEQEARCTERSLRGSQASGQSNLVATGAALKAYGIRPIGA